MQRGSVPATRRLSAAPDLIGREVAAHPFRLPAPPSRWARWAGLSSAAARAALRANWPWWAGLLVALALTTWAWLPWLDPRLNPWDRTEGLHDGKNHLLRLYVLGWLLERGVWYPRWVPDLFMGWGYPVFNYYAPGFYYLALLLKAALRLDTWDGYRAAGVVAALLAAAGSYALATALWRRRSLGVVAALTLLYGPYAFQVNLHRRGDVPEVLGLALLPWLLLAIWRLWSAQTLAQMALWLGGAAAAGGAEILVHNLTALVAAALAAGWVAYLLLTRFQGPRSKVQGVPGHRAALNFEPGTLNSLGLVALAGALALGLSAFFWLPALGERGEVQTEWLQYGMDYSAYFLHPGGHSLNQDRPENHQTRFGVVDLHLQYPHQLFAPPMISLAQAGLAALAAFGVVYASFRRRPVGPVLPLLLMAVVCWLLTLSISAPVWRLIPLLPLMQFPHRFLGPAGMCLALAGAGALAWPAAALERWGGRRGQLAAHGLVALVGGAVLFNSLGPRDLPFVDHPSREVNGDVLLFDELYDNLGMGTTSGREFLPRGVYLPTYTKNAPRGRAIFERLYPEADWAGDLFLPLGGDLRLLGWRTGPGTLSLSVRVANDAPGAGALAIRQLRFPGWRAWADGRRAPIGTATYIPEQQAALGYMVVDVPPGEHTITVAFGPTPLRLAGMVATLASGLIAAGALALLLRRQLRQRSRWPVALLLAGWLAVAAGLGSLTWRGVRPLWLAAAGPPAPVAHAIDGVWRAPDLERGGVGRAGLVVNVAEAVRTGQAQIDSPSGAALGPDRFVDVRQLTVADGDDPGRGLAGTSRREWLYMHPPSTVSLDVALPAGKAVWLQTALALDPAVWQAPVGDGVRFQVLVSPAAAEVSVTAADQAVVALDRTVNPRARSEERRWLPVAIDLSPWAGSTIHLTFRTHPGDDVSFDWAGWGNPAIAVEDTARTHPPPEATP